MSDVTVTKTQGRSPIWIWLAITGSLAVITVLSVVTWAVITKLDKTAFNMIFGGAIVLIVFVLAFLIAIAYHMAQSYTARRLLRQDDMNDARQLAMLLAMVRGGNPSINVRPGMPRYYPPMMGGGMGQQPQQFFWGGGSTPIQPGGFRDTTADIEIGAEHEG